LKKLRMLLASAVYVAFEFTLAAFAWGGFRPFFEHPQFVALLILTVVMMAISFASEISVSSGIKEDRSNRWVIGALSVLGIMLAFFPALTDRMGILVFGGEELRWIGVLLFALGGILRLYPVFVLGRRFSGLVAIQKDHTLVTDGIYGVVRNPSYLGLLINMLGWALTFRSGVGVIICFLTFLVLLARMNSEERLLHEYFGAEYDAYCARTARLIPWLY
jgi:protein-S-isoprenylcysteine O-methyltransferase Ste14